MALLASYATVDDLLRALVVLGYRKAPTIEPPAFRGTNPPTVFPGAEDDDGPARPGITFIRPPYWISSGEAALAAVGVRCIDIYPRLGEDGGSVYLQGHYDAEGHLDPLRWFACEVYAGGGKPVDPHQLQLEDIAAELNAWVRSWST